MLKPLALSLLLSLFAVSCAPGAFGPGTRGNPIRNSIAEVTQVRQNSETFLVTRGPIRLITRRQADEALDSVTPRTKPQAGEKFNTDVFWLRVKNVLAPSGIEVNLVRQTAVREIEEVGVTSYSFADSIDLVFSVKVPANAPVGSFPISVELVSVANPLSTGAAIMFVTVTPANAQP
jgi:hypothetical protein